MANAGQACCLAFLDGYCSVVMGWQQHLSLAWQSLTCMLDACGPGLCMHGSIYMILQLYSSPLYQQQQRGDYGKKGSQLGVLFLACSPLLIRSVSIEVLWSSF